MFLLDTNVVSELRKAKAGRADKNVVEWAASTVASTVFISAITVQELEIGVLLAERHDPAQGLILRRWLEAQVLPAFAERILPVDTAVARRSAALNVPDPQRLPVGADLGAPRRRRRSFRPARAYVRLWT